MSEIKKYSKSDGRRDVSQHNIKTDAIELQSRNTQNGSGKSIMEGVIEKFSDVGITKMEKADEPRRKASRKPSSVSSGKKGQEPSEQSMNRKNNVSKESRGPISEEGKIQENTSEKFDRDSGHIKEDRESKIYKGNLTNLLDFKKEEILKGIFVPTKINIIAEIPELNDYVGLNKQIWNWIRDNTEFINLRDLCSHHFGDIPISSRYSDKTILKLKEIAESSKISNFKDLSEYTKSCDDLPNIPHSRTIELLRNYFERRKKAGLTQEEKKNWDFIRWSRSLGFTPNYTNEEIIEWKSIIETPEVDSFVKAAEFILKKKGWIIKSETIIRNLENLFKNKGNFIEWVRKNTRYDYATEEGIVKEISEKEILKWKSILELPEINFWSDAISYMQIHEFEYVPDFGTMKRNLKDYFAINKLNYRAWLKENKLQYYYTIDDVLEWKSVIERSDIRTIPQASKFIKDEYGFGPTYSRIKSRLEELFRKKGWNFNKWLKENNLRVIHTDEEVLNEWIPEFGRIGNFTKVGELFNVDPGTVKNRIKEFLGDEYLKWYKEHSKRGLSQFIGTCAHPILELIFMDFMDHKKMFANYEIKPSSYDNDSVCDNSVVLVSTNKYNTKFISKIKKDVDMICVDYTLSSENITFIDKSKRGYHGDRKFLVINPLLTKKEKIKIPNTALFRDKILILNSEEYIKFWGFEGEYFRRYYEIIRLARLSHFNKLALNQLVILAEESQKLLSKRYGSLKEQQLKLEEYLEDCNLLALLKQAKFWYNING